MTVVLSRIGYLRNRTVLEVRFLRQSTNNNIFDDLRGLHGTVSPEKATNVKRMREFVANHTLVAFIDSPGRPKINQDSKIEPDSLHFFIKRLI